MFYSRSYLAVIRVYDEAGNVIEMHEHAMRSHLVAFGTVNRMQISNAVDYAKFRSRSHRPVIRVYDEAKSSDRKLTCFPFL